MNAFSKGVLFVAIIAFLLTVYYFFFVYNGPIAGAKIYKADKVTNYLDNPPEIPDPEARMVQGKPAPLFSYAALDNKTVRLADFKGKKPVILDFWATWCGPCQMELDLLQEINNEYGDKIEIIAVSSESAGMAKEIRQRAHDKWLMFDAMHDPSGKIENLYPHNAIPYIVFIDKDGTVIGTKTGFSAGMGQEVKTMFGL
jgi:thiol-disulfide isomerase/thioredoxin